MCGSQGDGARPKKPQSPLSSENRSRHIFAIIAIWCLTDLRDYRKFSPSNTPTAMPGDNMGKRKMTNFKYFADVNGETFELSRPYGMANAEFSALFADVRGRRYDGYAKLVGKAADGRVLPITREIEYKAHPSKHVCDARCLHATGKVMKCECSCGGKNHGRGDSVLEVA